ncbi:serine protease easter-like [Drosophila gunungcola]|uniref:Peptidase S1 domain-containing protein n=1 Tax=Drosophila gunungcola TaxID=103775 RepID=A0A9P9YTL0_9MUSC|nr:serine protease easter-like [Drosophila gunungcola]KAI8042888.1 hypothetical protein M5D96_004211 [Drosophila gunungcola]
MVQLVCEQDKICSGSLITSRFVLSAAHCFSWVFREPSYVCDKVRLGQQNTDNSQNTQVIDIERKIIHPQFNVGETYKNDIALLRLSQEVQFSDYIKPICLFAHQQETSFVVASWRKTEDGKKSNRLQATSVDKVVRQLCNNYFWMDLDDESQICARSSYEGVCPGELH